MESLYRTRQHSSRGQQDRRWLSLARPAPIAVYRPASTGAEVANLNVNRCTYSDWVTHQGAFGSISNNR